MWRIHDVLTARRSASRNSEGGFSLLELVVAVSIMLILGTVGTVSYQTYTKNARQAAVDTAATDVATAVVASLDSKDTEPADTIDQYNASTENIATSITNATEDGLTIAAIDRKGTFSSVTIPGDYSSVNTTDFHEPGVTFGWAGEPGRSHSIKYVDGEEVQRNYTTDPRATQHLSWWVNDETLTERTLVTNVSDHPQGIRTAAQTRSLRNSLHMSLYAVGGVEHQDDDDMYVGVWVKTNVASIASLTGYQPQDYKIDIPANTWTFITSDEAFHNNRPSLYVKPKNPDDVTEAIAWATGAIITKGAPPESYFDGGGVR